MELWDYLNLSLYIYMRVILKIKYHLSYHVWHTQTKIDPVHQNLALCSFMSFSYFDFPLLPFVGTFKMTILYTTKLLVEVNGIYTLHNLNHSLVLTEFFPWRKLLFDPFATHSQLLLDPLLHTVNQCHVHNSTQFSPKMFFLFSSGKPGILYSYLLCKFCLIKSIASLC